MVRQSTIPNLEGIRPRLHLPAHVSLEDFMAALSAAVPDYRFDQYRLYPSTNKAAWHGYRRARIVDSLEDPESLFWGDVVDGYPLLIGCTLPRWDEEHFGFRMAKINWMISQDTPQAAEVTQTLLERCIAALSSRDVKFVSARIDGDDLQNIHILERNRFLYYEAMIWPVVESTRLPFQKEARVRLIQDSDIPRVLEIVQHHQYKRGHLYTDPRFDPKTVDAMYVKWIQTSLKNKDPITVIEHEGQVVGSFAFRMDASLSSHLGYQYGRMKLLTLDPSFRGKGLGLAFFQGSMLLIAQLGSQWIDSGYASKNHISARVHAKSGFQSVYEELTFHRWL